jgi:hypothetical protein
VQRLLDSTWRIFENRTTDHSVKEDDRHRIATPDLIALLLADEEEEWGTANRGRAVTSYWLRENLRHLLDPPGTRQWEGRANGSQRGRRCRGYVKSQFERAWERYLPTFSSKDASESSGGSGGSGEDGQYQSVNSSAASAKASSIRGDSSTKATPDAAANPGSPNAPDPSNPGVPPDPPDPPHGSDRYGKVEEKPLVSNGDTRNDRERRLSQIDRDIVAFAEANPKHSLTSIAKHFGQPKAVVAELLGRDK